MFYCRMRYSKPLFPQQIQGLDYQTVKDILEWLERPITEIRNSVPAYESLAAQRVFEDSFSFDASDSPEANLPSWFDAFPVESFTEMDLIPSDGSLVSPCFPGNIHSFPSFMSSRCYAEGGSYNEDVSVSEFTDSVTTSSQVLGDSPSAEEDELCSQSTDIVQLIRMNQLRVEEIRRLQQKESHRITQLNELKREYAGLQEYYHRAEATIQGLVAREHDEETAAKLQELKGLLKLLETLTLQLNDSKQSYKEELEALNGQVKLRRQAMER